MKEGLCEDCGKTGAIHRHHTDFNHGNDCHDTEVLCPSCHRLKHTIAVRQRHPEIDQSFPGWSKGLSWQELMDARAYPSINVGNL